VADGIRATVYSPYSSCVMSLASIMVPIAIMMVEAATPMNSCKLPVADFLPISRAFLHCFASFGFGCCVKGLCSRLGFIGLVLMI